VGIQNTSGLHRFLCPRPGLRLGEERTWVDAPGIGALGNIIMPAPAPSLAFSGRHVFASAEVGVPTNFFFVLGRVFAPAVQPVYPRAPDHGPKTSRLGKAL
jgi:hypothetical protein